MNEQELFDQLSHGACGITPNQRLAAKLQQRYAVQQQAKQRHCWPTPHLLSFNAWLAKNWQLAEDSAPHNLLTLLSEQQALSLWEKIIAASDHAGAFLNMASTAKAVQTAWQLCQQFILQIDDVLFSYNDDASAFQQWAQQFIQICQKNAWLDKACLATQCQQLFTQQLLTPPRNIILIGFDELTPQQQGLLATLTALGSTTTHFDFTLDATVHQIALDDNAAELTYMTSWAKQRLAAGKQAIACVVPNLNEIRNQILQQFHEQLPKDSFNISAGVNFSRYPIIHSALQALTLNQKELPINDISLLLRSPFIGEAEFEMQARAQLDAVLRDFGEYELPISTLLKQAKKYHCEYLSQRLQSFLAAKTQTLLPSQWAAQFSQQLAALGWPGERSLTSEEYQLVQRWQNLLSELARLDMVLKTIALPQAIQQLRRLADNTIFQIQTNDAPIQILGLLEAAGLPFDCLWLMGLADEQWPASASPNAFIPIQVQRKLNMPHASAERELQFSQHLTQRFCHSATEVILSYPQQTADRTLQASPLIRDYKEISLSKLNLPTVTTLAEKLLATTILERLNDTQAPSVQANENIQGGTAILKHQAACPFRAFASVRLNATGLGEPQTGLHALERGIILHQTLEIIWRQLKTHNNLCKTQEAELNTLILTAINTSLADLKKYRPKLAAPRFVAIETQRLQQLIQQYLNLEKARPPFKVIAQEQASTIKLDELTFNCRADRIDELASGEKIIIDYKTATTRISDWFDERPNEPQLPIYAISHDDITGILFNQIRADEICIKGITELKSDIDGVYTLAEFNDENIARDWQAQKLQWQEILTNLSIAFYQGDATVDPKNPVETCQQCELHALCRIYE